MLKSIQLKFWKRISMKYSVTFEIHYLNGSSRFEDITFETKGKGKKVLKSHIKTYIQNTFIYERELHPIDVRIVYIKRYEELNPNNILNKDDYKKFIIKTIERYG